MKKKRWIVTTAALVLAALVVVGLVSVGRNVVEPDVARTLAGEEIHPSETYRPRTIITTDGECDDMNSFVHLLLYSNNMSIRGIVLTSSMYHYAGDAAQGIEPYRWAGEDWMDTYLAAYGQVYPALSAHDANYPTEGELRAVARVGNVATAGDMAADTEGSNLIREEILAKEDSILYLQCWGGSNTVARALRSIEESYGTDADWEQKKAEISGKLVIYLISTQDDTYEQYILVNWPGITVLHNTKSFGSMAFNWKCVLSGSQEGTMKAEWQIPNILHQDNPLLQLYYTYDDGREYPGERSQYQYGLTSFNIRKFWRELTYHGGFFQYGDYLSEGDSPAFLFLLDAGLQEAEQKNNYSLNNWGGTFHKEAEHYYVDDTNGSLSIGRYMTAINEDFAERVRWSGTTAQ